MTKNANYINSDNTIDKMTELVIKGLKSEDEELFTKRVCVLFSINADYLKMLVNGVPIKATVTDNEELCKLIKDCVEITNIVIDNNFSIVIYYKRRITRWFATQDDADKRNYWEGDTSPSEQYKVNKEFVVNKNTITPDEEMMKYIKVEYL